MNSSTLETVIGLEVHVQLATRTKLFCGCHNRFGAPPNSDCCAVCAGLPGALPVLNREAVSRALRLARALGSRVNRVSRFDRKNYSYPDLPRGYQITQQRQPLAEGGELEIWRPDGGRRRFALIRLQLEEDAGQSQHLRPQNLTLVNLNRAGVPLVEIVSAPAACSPAEAAELMRCLRGVVRALGISDGNMEQGSLRCDANISLRPRGGQQLGTRVELKNLNSFRFVERALAHEQRRQGALLQAGRPVIQQTRLWDPAGAATRGLRSKEQTRDYRYLPEPDLPPLVLEPQLIQRAGEGLPELPARRRARLLGLGLSADSAARLARERELTDYLDGAVAAGADPGRAAGWILTELLARVQDPRQLPQAPVAPGSLAGLLRLVDDGQLSGRQAKQLLDQMWSSGREAAELAREQGQTQLRDPQVLGRAVEQALSRHPEQVRRYREGQRKLLSFFMGQVMRATDGRADPALVNRLLRRRLQHQEDD